MGDLSICASSSRKLGMPFSSSLLSRSSTTLSTSQESLFPVPLTRNIEFFQFCVSAFLYSFKRLGCSDKERKEGNNNGNYPMFFCDRNPFSQFLYPRSSLRVSDTCATLHLELVWGQGRENKKKEKKDVLYIGHLTKEIYQKSTRSESILHCLYNVDQCIFMKKWNVFKFLVALTSAINSHFVSMNSHPLLSSWRAWVNDNEWTRRRRRKKSKEEICNNKTSKLLVHVYSQWMCGDYMKLIYTKGLWSYYLFLTLCLAI